MTEDQPDAVADEQANPDMEYDLAHEDLLDAASTSSQSEGRRATALPEMPADSGDYSYDLAHDIPRS